MYNLLTTKGRSLMMLYSLEACHVSVKHIKSKSISVISHSMKPRPYPILLLISPNNQGMGEECLALSFTGSQPLLMLVVYRPPKASSVFITEFAELLFSVCP